MLIQFPIDEVTVVLRGFLFLFVIVLLLLQKENRKRAEVKSNLLFLFNGLLYCIVFAVDIFVDHKVDPLFYNMWTKVLWMHLLIVWSAIELYRLRTYWGKKS